MTHSAASFVESFSGSEFGTRLSEARATTDRLFEIVRPEFLYERPIAERHRLAFYIGHLEAFDWNLLARLDERAIMDEMDRLFAFGIDPVDGDLPADRAEDWPRLAEIIAYRDTTRARVDDLLRRVTPRAPRAQQRERLLHVAIEHRQMHAETLCYLLHRLPFAAKLPRVHERTLPAALLVPHTVVVPAGAITLGLPADSAAFGWDNEFTAHEVHVPAVSIDAYKVTNGQFLQFVEAGGYEQRQFWRDDDWSWRTAHSIAHPAFWIRDAGAWYWKSMFDAVPLPLEWPAYVSHAEACAYATWAGRALPTEAQWQRAASGAPLGAARESFDPLPVNSERLTRSACGALGLLGNGWEWTCTPFAPFPAFAAFDFYPGYSAPFFDGRHFVLKGGSVRTAPQMLRPSFRNWFQPHYPYIYAGFRCVDRAQGGERP
jgi:iron(II)-dependent oxidoreductase